MKEIKGNDIIGKVGQPYLLALLKEKKAEVQEKMSNQKSQLYELQKKQMKSFMSNLKKQMKVRDKIIEQQKVLIQKNNIINRITYSQLHAIEEDNSAEKYNKNKSKREEKRNYSPYKNDSPHKNESK